MHWLEVDGVIYRELKTLNRVVIQDGPDAGKEEQVLVHTRFMAHCVPLEHYTLRPSGTLLFSGLHMMISQNFFCVCLF